MMVKRYMRDRIRDMLPNPNCTAGYPYKAEGNPCVLQDPSITPIEIDIFGNSKQESKVRPNLIPSGYDLPSTILITATENMDGTINVKYTHRVGEIGDDFSFATFSLPTGTYTFSYTVSGINHADVLLYCNDNSNDNLGESPYTFTVSETTNIRLRCLIKNAYDSENFTIQFKLEEGESATEYVPYGTVIPSPDYPAEVESVGDLITDEADVNYGKYRLPVSVRGKNLVDFFNTANWTNRSTYWGDIFLDLVAGETYTISFDYDELPNFFYFQYQTQDATTWNTLVYLTTNKEKETQRTYTFTAKENTKYRLSKFKDDTVGNSLSRELKRFTFFQLEKSKTATPYEPYFNRTVNVFLDEPLRGIPSSAGGWIARDSLKMEKGKVQRVQRVKSEIDGNTTSSIADNTALLLSEPNITDMTDTEAGQALLVLGYEPNRTNIFSVDTAVPGTLSIGYHSFDYREENPNV
ncbi:MAG: hypothetical protein IJW78_03430 [Clostridia bacterium]|nr:hypothetical protein [Clostridia bacterium]